MMGQHAEPARCVEPGFVSNQASNGLALEGVDAHGPDLFEQPDEAIVDMIPAHGL